jgi:deoxyribose-phosphate aldolase
MNNQQTQDKLNRDKIKSVQDIAPTLHHAQTAMASLDLTSLTGVETDNEIIALCDKAKQGHVAAVCVYPQYVARVAELLEGTDIQIATVINFPHGDMTNEGETATPENTEKAVKDAIVNGATEIDIVMDYKDYMNEAHARSLLRACKNACGDGVKMKVILETAAFELEDDIACLASMAIEESANFIKTSTGKYSDPEFPEIGGATFDAVLTMVNVIKKHQAERTVGLKISGGVSDSNFAAFIELVTGEIDNDFLNSNTFRIGASGLYNYLHLSIETNGQVINHVNKHGTLGY